MRSALEPVRTYAYQTQRCASASLSGPPGSITAGHRFCVAILIALTRGSGVLPHVLDEKLLKSRKARVETLARMHHVGGATKEAVDAAAAAMVAMIVATATMTAAAGS